MSAENAPTANEQNMRDIHLFQEAEVMPLDIPAHMVDKWQKIVDIIAAMANIPACLIMRIVAEDIEVFMPSSTEGNPYHKGDKEHLLGSGLYCETVISTKRELYVPNALEDETWKNNPDIKLNMISYMGFPILFPNGKPFGTICALDKKRLVTEDGVRSLLEQFRDILQFHLELLYMNHTLGDINKSLTDYIAEIQTLRGIIPICAYCRKVRDGKGQWQSLEEYILGNTAAMISHGVCPECFEKFRQENGLNSNRSQAASFVKAGPIR